MWLTSYPGNSLTRIDPIADMATATLSLASIGDGPIGVTVFDGSVWVANHDGRPTGSVAKIDPSTMEILDVIPAGNASFAGPSSIAGGAGSIWVDVPNISAVVRIDPATDAIIATVPDKSACAALDATDDGTWVAGGNPPGCLPGITRIDPTTNRVTAYINAGGPSGPLRVDAATSSVWYGTDQSAFLGRVDMSTATVVGQLKLPGPAFGIAAGYGFVWVTDRVDGLLFKVRPT